MTTEEKTKREIYTYKAPWNVYSLNWSIREDPACQFRLAVGSFIEEYNNKVEIVKLNLATDEFESEGSFEHPYPTTKIMWIPDHYCTKKDLVATTGDYLRLWHVTDTGVQMEALLNTQSKSSEYCAPLTSFDWNECENSLVVTSSIDTTCTVWDIEKKVARTQLIAHDREVYDVAWATRGKDIFATVGADGSVRVFDLRKLEHSTIMYESPELTPLLRLAWNRQDPNYMATTMLDSPQTVIIDIRVPAVPVAKLNAHVACVNGVTWAPHSSCHLCTASDDKQALIWDVGGIPAPVEDPILAYSAGGEINQLQWSVSHVDWVAIAYNDSMQILRV